MTTLIALLAFPCCAILWLVLCDRLGMVRDEPLIKDQERERQTHQKSTGAAMVTEQVSLSVAAAHIGPTVYRKRQLRKSEQPG